MKLRSIIAGACIGLLLTGCGSDGGSVGPGADSVGTGADVPPAEAEPSVERLAHCAPATGGGHLEADYLEDTVGSRSPREALVESVSRMRAKDVVDIPTVPETISSEYTANGYVDVHGDATVRQLSYVENGKPLVIWRMERLPTDTWVPGAITYCGT